MLYFINLLDFFCIEIDIFNFWKIQAHAWYTIYYDLLLLSFIIYYDMIQFIIRNVYRFTNIGGCTVIDVACM